MRSPCASDPPIISSSDFTAMSTSSAFRCAWRWVRMSINSDLVMDTVIVVAGQCGGPARSRATTYRLLGLALQLLAQQGAELGRAAGGIGRSAVVLGQGLGRLGLVLGLDRQLQRAALAIHADELGLDRVADLQPLAGVLDALVGDVAGGHVAFHAIGQLDHRTLGVDFLDGAADLRAARMCRHELAERVLL